MARRGRKPKAVQPKDFLFSNDKDFNKHHSAGSKGFVFSSAAKFMNLFPKGKNDIYMTPVKKGERLGYGKYRIEAHHPNKHSDDRDAYEAKRKNKDLFYKNPLTTPTRIKYDGITHTAGYHLVTHDRDGKRVEFWLKAYKPGGATVMAEMYLPDLERDGTRKKAKKGQDLKKLMSCSVIVGKINASASKKGQLKFTKSKPQGECAKYGNSNAKYGKPLNPKEYEKQAEGQETFLSEDDMIYFYAMTGQEMDLSDYQAIDSVEVDRTSYQPTQDYGAETFEAESKSMFGKDKNGRMYARRRNGRIITHNAETIHEKGDYRIIAEEDYDVSTGGVFQEREDFDDLMELSDTHGMFTLMLQKKVMGGWETIDSVSGVVPHYGDMEDVVLKELNIPDGVNFDAESEAATYAPSNDPDMVNAIQTSPSNENPVLFAEGDAATYSPSNDPDMVNSIPTEPTNESFESESKNKWVKGKNGKTYVLRNKTGRMVTHNAETLEDFNGMESVVVEPPLGHGVAQWYAEGDSATYTPSSSPDMVNEIQTEPTNANADLFGSETLAEIEGPTAEATAGGLHSPSSFDISWEDGNGLSSASMPPNEIAWAENKETYCAGCKAAESGCHCSEGYDAESLADYQAIDSIEVDATSYQPTQDYGSEFEGEFADDMKKGAAYGLGGYAGFVGFGLIASSIVLAVELIGRKMGE